MKSEHEIAKENIRNSKLEHLPELAQANISGMIIEHLASCKRFLEFLEDILPEDGWIQLGYHIKMANKMQDKERDLKKAISVYKENGIKVY